MAPRRGADVGRRCWQSLVGRRADHARQRADGLDGVRLRRVLAEAVATPSLHVLERMADGSRRRAVELPLYRKLNLQPNGWQTSFEWRCQLMLHLCLYNEAYCEII
ncbi:MAG: phage portal protein, partial [Alphaproteobacteria bacterium]|nr:phage portal protein [Alphaproteobacteria bacterium]